MYASADVCPLVRSTDTHSLTHTHTHTALPTAVTVNIANARDFFERQLHMWNEPQGS